MNFGFVIDNRNCIGCHACTVACKSEHDVPIGVNRTWVKYVEKGQFPDTRRVFSVMRCNHCETHPVLKSARPRRCTRVRTALWISTTNVASAASHAHKPAPTTRSTSILKIIPRPSATTARTKSIMEYSQRVSPYVPQKPSFPEIWMIRGARLQTSLPDSR